MSIFGSLVQLELQYPAFAAMQILRSFEPPVPKWVCRAICSAMPEKEQHHQSSKNGKYTFYFFSVWTIARLTL